MSLRTLVIHFLCILLLALVAPLRAADFVLVAKDTPPAPIMIFKEAPPRTRDAALTLADYIEKISGDGRRTPVCRPAGDRGHRGTDA